MSNIDTVYIGNKPPMAYVMALITAFNNSNQNSVVLKARGRAISRAVDVAEIARNRYMSDVKATKIELGSEQLPAQGGGTRGVSTISITLERQSVATAPEPEKEPEPKKEAKKAEAPPQSLDVSDIKGVGSATEGKLKDAGYTTVKLIARAKTETLSRKTGLSEKVSEKIIESAKELVK
ncbi:MAG: DNA-binding protein Alba [Candidatus Bathyarchaeota archaeon]|nr:MAG: DNA-binding protein Alba [Candidatus Bathyarchaeota archaeon]